MLRFKELYQTEIRPAMQKEFAYTNPMMLPSLKMVVISMGVGAAVADTKELTHAVEDLTLIAGQKPIITKAKKSISTFKLREGMPIGCKVTLRHDRMYAFLERLVMVALPRMRDFKGFSSKSFDGNGNFSFGLNQQVAFLEIDYDKISKLRGLNITLVTSAKTNAEAKALLAGFHFPFTH
jgi:large subunit ribosomal protein L5